jgi:hypothetical protein
VAARGEALRASRGHAEYEVGVYFGLVARQLTTGIWKAPSKAPSKAHRGKTAARAALAMELLFLAGE